MLKSNDNINDLPPTSIFESPIPSMKWGYVFAYKGKKNCSTKLAKTTCMSLVNGVAEQGTIILPKKVLNLFNKKVGKLDRLKDNSVCKNDLNTDYIDDTPTFYCTFIDDPIMDEIWKQFDGKQISKNILLKI